MDTTFYYQLDLDTQWLCTVLCAMWLTGSTRPRGTKKPRRRSSALARVHWSPLETSRTLFHTHNNNPLPHYPFVPLPYFSVSRRFFATCPLFAGDLPALFRTLSQETIWSCGSHPALFSCHYYSLPPLDRSLQLPFGLGVVPPVWSWSSYSKVSLNHTVRKHRICHITDSLSSSVGLRAWIRTKVIDLEVGKMTDVNILTWR